MALLVNRRAWLGGAVVLALAGRAQAQGQPEREIVIGLSSSSLGTAGLRIAKELGLYAKHGLNPRFVVLDSANGTMAALISKSILAGHAGPPELAAANARGQKVVVICNSYSGFGPSLVLSNVTIAKLGVSANAPINERLKALDGLLIGSPSATSVATVAVSGSAKLVGATPRFTYMAQPTLQAALESGAIQGYVASAPYWAFPISKGTGSMWISGPKGEFRPEVTPSLTAELQVLREVAEADPQTMHNLAAVLADLSKAIDERPAEVKAAMVKLYPDLDPQMADLLYASESIGWKTTPPTVAEMVHELAVVKASGMQIPNIDSLDPASLIFH